MAKTYYTVLTTYGSQLFAQAMANRQPVRITQFAVGDGNGRAVQPDSARTSLVRQVHRANISAVSPDPRNNRQVIFELTIPENVGGFWIREMGIYDANNRLVAYANCPDTYKPQLSEGSGKVQVMRMILLVSSSQAVTLTVDDTVIFATRGQLTPKTITATSQNGVDDTGHSHTIDHATTGQKGIVQLTNDTGLDSEALALTAKAGKKLAQEIAKNHQLASSKYTAQDASTSQKGLVQLVDNLTSSNNDKALTAKQGKTLNDKIKYIYNIVKSNNIPVNLDLTSRDQIIAEMGGNYQGVGVYRFTFHNLINHNITGLPLGDIKGAVAIELEVMGGFSRMSCQYLYANRLFYTHVDWNKPTLTLRWYEVISQNADSAVYLRNTEKNRTSSIIITDDSVDMSRDLDGRKTLSNYEVRVGKHLKSIYRTHLLTNKNAEIELSGKDANDTWKRFLTMLTATGNVIVGTVPDNGRDRLQINGTVKATAPAADANNDQLPTTAWVNSALAPKVDKLVQQTLDLTSLDPDKWYPVVLKMVDVRKLYRFAVRRALGDGNNPTWATHGAGFSTYCEWETQPSQWGAYPYIDSMRLIRQFTYAYCHQSPMLKIGQIYQASWEYIYLRGGTSYTLSRESDVIVDIGVNGYTWQHSPYSANLPIIESYDESLVPKTSRQAIKDSINDEMVGQVAFFASSTPPSGWLKANGAAVSRTTYAALFARIGTRFGAGDGSTTFNLPDLRGEFVRGWDDGRNIDAGRGLGSHQGDAIRNIVGEMKADTTNSGSTQFIDNLICSGAFDRINGNKAWTGDSGGWAGQAWGAKFDASRVVPTANENRPRNIALLACIKY